MNVLSGYTANSVSGSVQVNGREGRDLIRRESNYITQDYSLHPFITVSEAMHFAVNLKMNHMNDADKYFKVI